MQREVKFSIQSWVLKEPFSITGHTFTEVKLLFVEIKQGGYTGRGEASGVYYLDETGSSMLAQVKHVKQALENGADRHAIDKLLSAGGARNAIDCALWDLECKILGQYIWSSIGLIPKQVCTVNTVGIDTPELMAKKAKTIDAKNIKVKIDGNQPLEQITAVCLARPNANIVVDVNQGWNFGQLQEFAPKFKALGVKMIEQPLPRGHDSELENYSSPLPLCADESCLDSSELIKASKRYQMINIKLDKTGGLTEALVLAEKAKSLGMGLMVGNMMGTSLAMAPAFVIAQLCDFVDLDGALFLVKDRSNAMSYEGGVVSIFNSALWG